MPWDGTKSKGSKLTADEWNTHTSDQKAHKTRHEDGGSDEVAADATKIKGKTVDDSAIGDGKVLTYQAASGNIEYAAGGAPGAHAATHENGGGDEINVGGLSGLLGDPQTPLGHAASHKDGGADELDVSELAGAIGGAGEVPETDGAAVSWVEPDGRYDPKAHENSHIKGGSDDIDAALDGRAIAITTQGDLVYGSAANTINRLGAGTAGQTLKTGGAGANPSWTWDKELDNAPDATDTGNGIITSDTVGEGVIPGDVLYMKADGKYWKADADAAASMPAVVMAMETKAADNVCKLLHMGYFREDSRWNWTLGNGEANLLFVHTTAGDIVQFANKPSATGDQVQVVGYVVTADIVFFNPSLELVEIA